MLYRWGEQVVFKHDLKAFWMVLKITHTESLQRIFHGKGVSVVVLDLDLVLVFKSKRNTGILCGNSQGLWEKQIFCILMRIKHLLASRAGELPDSFSWWAALLYVSPASALKSPSSYSHDTLSCHSSLGKGALNPPQPDTKPGKENRRGKVIQWALSLPPKIRGSLFLIKSNKKEIPYMRPLLRYVLC